MIKLIRRMCLGKRCQITVQNVNGKIIWHVILKTCLCYVFITYMTNIIMKTLNENEFTYLPLRTIGTCVSWWIWQAISYQMHRINERDFQNSFLVTSNKFKEWFLKKEISMHQSCFDKINWWQDMICQGHQWSRDFLIVSMTIRLCQNHIESIVDNIYGKLEQKFVSITVCVGKYSTSFLKDTYVLIGTKGLISYWPMSVRVKQ